MPRLPLSLLLTVLSTTAAAQVVEPPIAVCPYNPDYSEVYTDPELERVCLLDDPLQEVTRDGFMAELDRFQHQVDRAALDMITDSAQLASHLVYQLREHVDCLEQLCYSAWLECTQQVPITPSQTSESLQWCLHTIEWITQVQEEKIESTLLERQNLLATGLLDEKHYALHWRYDAYMEPALLSLSSQLHEFLKGITALIKVPFAFRPLWWWV
ncbi:hypothetical protein H6771_02100 [Candidatus Peribacteria bacterium]|nr:hypothetical protein [Candidatus Peribacteria bacterium]